MLSTLDAWEVDGGCVCTHGREKPSSRWLLPCCTTWWNPNFALKPCGWGIFQNFHDVDPGRQLPYYTVDASITIMNSNAT